MLGADVASQGAVEGAVELGAVQLAEHALGGDDDDAPGGLRQALYATARARNVLPVPGMPMKSGLTPGVEEREVVQGEVAGPHLLAGWVEVEVEGVDRVDLGEVRVADAPLDGAAQPALLLLVAEAVDDVQRSDRFSFAARSRSAAMALAMPGSLSQRSLSHEQSRACRRPSSTHPLRCGSLAEAEVPGSRVIGVGARLVVDGQVGVWHRDGVENVVAEAQRGGLWNEAAL